MDYKKLIKLLGCREGNELCKSSTMSVFYGYACDRCRETIMQEAATAIETLLAEREAAGWISVKDGLPRSIANKVLVCCKNGYVGFGHYEDYKGVQTWFNLESGKPFSEWAYDEPDDYDVTHWIPLPTPPDCQQTESLGRE